MSFTMVTTPLPTSLAQLIKEEAVVYNRSISFQVHYWWNLAQQANQEQFKLIEGALDITGPRDETITVSAELEQLIRAKALDKKTPFEIFMAEQLNLGRVFEKYQTRRSPKPAGLK